jgi:putative heme iron utilization protein
VSEGLMIVSHRIVRIQYYYVQLETNILVVADDVDTAFICRMTIDEAGAQLLSYAVSNHYWYQMFIDELPVWGMVGEIVADEDVITELESHIEKPHGIADATFLYTHRNLYVDASEI